jgi:hypothetical protein
MAHRHPTNYNKDKALKLAVSHLLGLVTLAACAAVPRQAQSIRIANATYRVQDLTIPCDVTSKVATLCDGLVDCSVLAQSRLCPMGDPAPTRQKFLAVKYTCGAADTLQTEVQEGKNLILSCRK